MVRIMSQCQVLTSKKEWRYKGRVCKIKDFITTGCSLLPIHHKLDSLWMAKAHQNSCWKEGALTRLDFQQLHQKYIRLLPSLHCRTVFEQIRILCCVSRSCVTNVNRFAVISKSNENTDYLSVGKELTA